MRSTSSVALKGLDMKSSACDFSRPDAMIDSSLFTDQSAELIELDRGVADQFHDGVERFGDFAGDSRQSDRQADGKVAPFQIFECCQYLGRIKRVVDARLPGHDAPHAGSR